MARRKKKPLLPWETRKPDGIEVRYVRLGNSLLMAKEIRALSNSAFRVYINMLIECAGNKNFTFPFHKYRDYMTRPTFEKALKELVSVGLVDVVSRNKNLRKANEYAFSDRYKTI